MKIAEEALGFLIEKHPEIVTHILKYAVRSDIRVSYTLKSRGREPMEMNFKIDGKVYSVTIDDSSGKNVYSLS